MTDEVLHPKHITIPKLTAAERNALTAEEGALIYNLDDNKLNVCDVDATTGASSWAAITSS